MSSHSSSEPFRRIGMHARAESRKLMLALVEELKRRHGSEIHLYCPTPQTAEFYQPYVRSGLLASVNDAGQLLRANLLPRRDPEQVFAQARSMERFVGLTYNALMVSNRHLGHGYALGGFHHPRSRYGEESDYVRAVDAYNVYLDFLKREFRDRRLTMVLNGGKEFAVMARAYGIPYRFNCGARVDNLHFWGWNEFQENPEIEAAFATSRASDTSALAAPYLTHRVNRTLFMDEVKPLKVARDVLRRFAMHMWWRWKGYQKARGYYLWDEINFYIRRWRGWNALMRIATTKLADLPENGFVYYPLHVEPEAALQELSPEFFYQLSLIAAVARDLPAGVKLAVKEAFGAVGRRPDDFYGQIRDFKNVVMLDPMEMGIECVRRSAAVVTICGTGGFEGATMGKPVIAFGRHNSYNILPHVHTIRDETELAARLSAALSPDFDRRAALRDGQRFLQAVRSVSYDLRQFNYIDQDNFDPATVRDACDALERSLALQVGGVPQPSAQARASFAE